ncbi:hypothetical protein COCNU_02G013660 [Cocos nucifera]|uniref:Uncharacterized protein n=1 Tax=Cocos nucifera TaxID=13894 RepID=A0A8K0MXG4_COCNU|nr:hypothetical protein COCNU_02G013660 [Cocos nucifera]
MGDGQVLEKKLGLQADVEVNDDMGDLGNSRKSDLTIKQKYLVAFAVGYDQKKIIDAAVKKEWELILIIIVNGANFVKLGGCKQLLALGNDAHNSFLTSITTGPLDEISSMLMWYFSMVSGPYTFGKLQKPFSENFTILLFHYDGRTSEWDEFEWSKQAIHVSARKQTKWWYAKRFLHPDIVAPYDYIFIWDEDLGVEHFNAEEYIKLVKKHGLEISQPGLVQNTGLVTWQMTRRREDSEPAHEKIGVVDSQWIVHHVVPSLGNQGKAANGKPPWQRVRERCRKEWWMFQKRMADAEIAYCKEMGIPPPKTTAFRQ